MKEGVESLGRVRAQAIVLLVIAFLSGAFVGGTMERVMARPSRSAAGVRGTYSRGGAQPSRAPRAPGSLPGGYDALGLSADQHAKIEAILAKRSARVDSAMKIACRVIGPARDSTTKEAEAVLTADQRARRDSVRAARAGSGRGSGRAGTFIGCGPGTPPTAKK